MKQTVIGPVFFLILAASSTLAATNVGVGSPCSAADTCVTGAVCDRVYAKCLLLKGQACSGENAGNCVFGASCTTTCECGDGYTAATTLCAPKNTGTVGTDCTTAESLCTTPNSECSTLKACKCKAGYLLNISDGKCTAENKGSAPGYISVWLLSVSFMAVSLATYMF